MVFKRAASIVPLLRRALIITKSKILIFKKAMKVRFLDRLGDSHFIDFIH